mgnify:CR=1 FL=1
MFKFLNGYVASESKFRHAHLDRVLVAHVIGWGFTIGMF